jgi:hypothetical protein
MHIFWHKVEKYVDASIPLCLVVLLYIIILEIFFHETAHHYHFEIVFTDNIIIFIFILDLAFKYIRMQNVPQFLKRYWLEIMAVFPFYLFFRMVEFFLSFATFSESLQSFQQILHEGLEIDNEGSKIAAQAGKSARFNNLIRLIRPMLRLPRFLKVVGFFERPTGSHHHYEPHHMHKIHKYHNKRKSHKAHAA